MNYIRIKAPERVPITNWNRRSFENWRRAWRRAKHLQERLGLLREIYDTSHPYPFRWLLETADEFRALAGQSAGARRELITIAETALEMAVRRTLKGCSVSAFSQKQEDVECLLWFMRTEGGVFVNMSRLKLGDSYVGYLWDVVETICRGAFSTEQNSWYYPYRRNAVFILAARGDLPSLIPNVLFPHPGSHPWNVFDEVVMQALEELALDDAKKIWGDSVEFALVHGSQAAAIYTAAKQAREVLHRMQGSGTA